MGWGYGDEEFFTRQELIEKFTLERINKAACTIGKPMCTLPNFSGLSTGEVAARLDSVTLDICWRIATIAGRMRHCRTIEPIVQNQIGR